MKKNSKAFEIALSAISAALSSIFLTLGTLNNYLLATGYVLGSLFLILPLTKDFWLGDILAYMAACLIAMLFGGVAFIWRLLPFIIFFGLHPLVNYFQLRFKWNRFLLAAIKAVWFDGMLFLVWKFVFNGITNFSFVDEYIIPVILVLGTLVGIVYDYLMFKCYQSAILFVNKIKK